MGVNRVLHTLLTGEEECEGILWPVGRDEPLLGGGGAGAADKDILLGLATGDVGGETGIALLVDQCRFPLIQCLPVDAVGTKCFVDGAVEEGVVVVGPGYRGGTDHGEAYLLSALLILDLHHELSVRACLVEEVGHLAVVGTHRVASEDEGCLPLGHRVQVEEYLLGCFHRSLAATVGAVLFSLLGATVIVVAVAEGWVTLVILLDAAHDLIVNGLLELFCGGHYRVGVSVLRLEVVNHFGIVLVFQPEIVVDA